MAKLFFKNETTGKMYEIVKFDREKGEVVLKGPHATFREKYDKEWLQKMGYTLVQETADGEGT